jgi:hypothetical protein
MDPFDEAEAEYEVIRNRMSLNRMYNRGLTEEEIRSMWEFHDNVMRYRRRIYNEALAQNNQNTIDKLFNHVFDSHIVFLNRFISSYYRLHRSLRINHNYHIKEFPIDGEVINIKSLGRNLTGSQLL